MGQTGLPNSGNLPGIRDEYQQFIGQHAQGPVYLLGLLGGETRRIIEELQSQGRCEPNGLNDAGVELLHSSEDIDLIAPMVVEDLERVAAA